MEKQFLTKEPESHYFEFQASWGLTKHMGGRDATVELAEACRIDKDTYVLDVGSGVGITACMLAQEYGCEVVGMDLSEDMVKRAQERAARKKLSDKIKFTLGDARDIPFEDGIFDAVLCESVVAFSKEKQKVITEYKRATKTGGFLGINEVTWIRNPPLEQAQYLYMALGGAEFLTPDGWKHLFKNAGFKDIKANIYKTNVLRQWKSEVAQMNPRDYLGAWGKFFFILIKSPEARKWIKRIAVPLKSILNFFNYFGYGIYVAQK
ncbi:MAG: class I SAM-dependent methyltransferase [Acidobacteriota bacterium]